MLEEFIKLEKVQNSLQSIREYVNKNFDEYMLSFDQNISDYKTLRKKEQGLWISLISIKTSLRYCLEALEQLDELQFQIVLTAIIEDFESYSHPHANFERTFSVICRQLEFFKIEFKRTNEVAELFKE